MRTSIRNEAVPEHSNVLYYEIRSDFTLRAKLNSQNKSPFLTHIYLEYGFNYGADFNILSKVLKLLIHLVNQIVTNSQVSSPTVVGKQS